jgi:hypothetical protein
VFRSSTRCSGRKLIAGRRRDVGDAAQDTFDKLHIRPPAAVFQILYSQQCCGFFSDGCADELIDRNIVTLGEFSKFLVQ